MRFNNIDVLLLVSIVNTTVNASPHGIVSASHGIVEPCHTAGVSSDQYLVVDDSSHSTIQQSVSSPDRSPNQAPLQDFNALHHSSYSTAQTSSDSTAQTFEPLTSHESTPLKRLHPTREEDAHNSTNLSTIDTAQKVSQYSKRKEPELLIDPGTKENWHMLDTVEWGAITCGPGERPHGYKTANDDLKEEIGYLDVQHPQQITNPGPSKGTRCRDVSCKLSIHIEWCSDYDHPITLPNAKALAEEAKRLRDQCLWYYNFHGDPKMTVVGKIESKDGKQTIGIFGGVGSKQC